MTGNSEQTATAAGSPPAVVQVAKVAAEAQVDTNRLQHLYDIQQLV
jgi:hypothetical protein